MIAPLKSSLGDATHLLISPDGPLNLIPFEALRDGRRYLVEDHLISYVTSGRDLLRTTTPRPRSRGFVVFADPDFGPPRGEQSPSRTDRPAQYFARLGATLGEAQRIVDIFPDATVRSAGQATEGALKALHAPRVLHIATHGFFRADAGIENPLLRSGLALAGANLPRGGNDDGILTALEAANLDLWGTRLVALSACDTGVGVVRNGEGVYGLRRAFFLAGAETLVMSLWPVSDVITREMMSGYYAGLKQGLGRGAALRRMQVQMLKRPGRAHPFYWASFIQAGNWRSLDSR